MNTKIPENKIQEFFDLRINKIKEKQERELKTLSDFIKGKEVLEMSDRIDEVWKGVVCSHSEELKKNNGALKLIILGEAPLSENKYFYKSQGTFLDSLRVFWELPTNKKLPAKMLEKRVLLLDIYKWPIPSDFYTKDENQILLDKDYVQSKIDLLKKSELIDANTHFVFRYKKLFKTRSIPAFNELKFLKDRNGDLVSFNKGEKPQELNENVKEYLTNYCK
jgi:hypothetical protein